jgi:multiple antibiotic resistance protein
MPIYKILLAFVPIFVAIDAFGTVPVFLMLAGNTEKKKVRKILLNSIIAAFLLGVAFIFVGKAVFRLLNITVWDFMVAGGSLLFVISIKSLLGEDESGAKTPSDFAVVPLATPLIVGPAVLASLILLVDLYGIRVTLLSFVINIIITGLVFLNALNIRKILGRGGIRAFSRVTSLFLAAIAVMLVRRGVLEIIKGFINAGS